MIKKILGWFGYISIQEHQHLLDYAIGIPHNGGIVYGQQSKIAKLMTENIKLQIDIEQLDKHLENILNEGGNNRVKAGDAKSYYAEQPLSEFVNKYHSTKDPIDRNNGEDIE